MVSSERNFVLFTTAAATTAVIRTASLRDVDRLTDVLTNSFYSDNGWRQWLLPFIRLGIQADLQQRLRAESPRYTCLAAVFPASDGGREAIAGTVEASLRSPWPWPGDRHLYISNLAVGQRFRRQGIARALLQSCEQVAQGWQVRELRLHVMEDNLTARALYQDAGFSTLEVENSPASWLGLQPRRLLLHRQLLHRQL